MPNAAEPVRTGTAAPRERIDMVCEASLRRAPCSPPRTQVDFELAYGMLREIEVAHPEARRAVARALLALRRESEAEGLTYRVG